jgi:hypothetical protein
LNRFAAMRALATMLAISSCFLSICSASQDVLDDEPQQEPCPLGIIFLAPAPGAEVPPPSVELRFQGEITRTLFAALIDDAGTWYPFARIATEPGGIVAAHYEGLPPSTQFTVQGFRACDARHTDIPLATLHFRTGP